MGVGLMPTGTIETGSNALYMVSSAHQGRPIAICNNTYIDCYIANKVTC